jgi:hypothetical protein
MDFGLAQIVAVATLLWVLGGSGGPKIGYDNGAPPPPPQSAPATPQR